MTRNLIVVAVIAVLMGAFVVVLRARTGAISPPIKGYVEGREFRFAHTEASDSVVADTLSDMTGSPVLLVKSLADTPESMLAPDYVFANGVHGDGPLGYQPDIFDRAPGTPGYTPLRRLHLVQWKNPSAARVLKSAEDLLAAQRAGDLTIEPQEVVINMPFLTWPGGSR